MTLFIFQSFFAERKVTNYLSLSQTLPEIYSVFFSLPVRLNISGYPAYNQEVREGMKNAPHGGPALRTRV